MFNNYGLKGVKDIENSVVLKEVKISGNVCGEFVELSTKQVYENRGNEDIEAEYIFPIPDTAVITGFEANLGGRIFKAQVQDKKMAEKIYNETIQSNGTTFILEEIDDNVFKITLGKVLRSETVKIKVSYIDQLLYEDGDLKLVIPAVLSPKYIKNIDNSEGLEAITKEPDYHLRLNLLVEPLSKINIISHTHDIKVQWDEGNLAKVTFRDEDAYLDEDFILFFKEEEHPEASGMIYEYKEEEEAKGILYLRVIPDLEEEEDEQFRNYDFLIDISESMEGEKLEEAKNALQLCLRSLSEGDTFNIVAAENELHYFSKGGKVPFNEENLRSASRWIDGLEVLDDAEIFDALKYCLNEKNMKGYSTILIFTDDEGEKDEEIVEYVRKNIGDNRIFTFGIDASASSYFINKLAEVGYGKSEFIYPGEGIDDMVLRQFSRIENPQVDITSIDWGNMQVQRTYPRTIDYLYDDEPFSIFAKVNGEIEGKVIICGKVGKKDYKQVINLDTLDLEENANLIQKVWMRKRIESIEEKARAEKGILAKMMREKVEELSKESGIISSLTSFVMLEVIEEPVLGIGIKRLLPVVVSDETMKNITEAYFIEAPNFIYKAVNKEKSKASVRKNYLRILAKNQLAEGTFADYEDTNLKNKLETTAIVVLAFVLGKEDINVYTNQITKSIKFMSKALDENLEDLNEKTKSLIILSLKACVEKGVAKGILKQQVEEKLQHMYYDKKASLRNTVSILFGLLSEAKAVENRVGENYASIPMREAALLAYLTVV